MNKTNPKSAKKEKEAKVPTDLQRALSATPKVLALWKDITPIARRDFISWIDSAKQPETRKRRIEITGSKLLAGKRRPCCYALVPMNLYKAFAVIPKAKAQWKVLTSAERRDFVDWIDEAKQSDTHAHRINEACVKLVAGKRQP